jgi:hypothetical protein
LQPRYIVAAVKVRVYNEEQLRGRQDRTCRGPTDDPLLQPDPPYWGFRDLTKDAAKVGAEHLRRLQGGDVEPLSEAA